MCCPTAARIVALVGLGLGAGAGCGDGTTGTPATPAPVPVVTASLTTEADANTTAICGRLININFAGERAFIVHWNKLLKAVAAGDEAASAVAGEAAKQELQTWAVELDLLADDAVEPQLRTVIQDGSATLVKLASDEDDTPVDQVLPTIAEIDQRYDASCP